MRAQLMYPVDEEQSISSRPFETANCSSCVVFKQMLVTLVSELRRFALVASNCTSSALLVPTSLHGATRSELVPLVQLQGALIAVYWRNQPISANDKDDFVK